MPLIAIRRLAWCALVTACIVVLPTPAHAAGWLAPGDAGLRDDIERLVDESVIDVPLLAWPIHSDAVKLALDSIPPGKQLTASQQATVQRLRLALAADEAAYYWVGGTNQPSPVRTFADGPRGDGIAGLQGNIQGDAWAVRVRAEVVANPADGQPLRPDGSYLSGHLGNWVFTAGWLQRWWGPGWDGSLILGTAARPVPALSIDRGAALPFRSAWLHWIGPWTVSAFVGAMERKRPDRDHPLLMGMRAAFRPLDGLEISFERTAQWCAAGLPCNPTAFWDVITGRDNVGENVSAKKEPGNQLFGFSWRWSSPIGHAPYAFYSQITGETGSQSKLLFLPRPVARLFLGGAEIWGEAGDVPWRMYAEYADTACNGSHSVTFDCAYNNHLFNVEGYRYHGVPVGHALDGDGRMYSLGLQLRGALGANWQVLARKLEINRGGVVPDRRNSLSPAPLDEWEGQVRADFDWMGGRVNVGLAAARLEPQAAPGKTQGRVFLTYSRPF